MSPSRSAGSYYDASERRPKLVRDRITKLDTVASAVVVNKDGSKLVGSTALKAAALNKAPVQNCLEGFKRLLGKRYVCIYNTKQMMSNCILLHISLPYILMPLCVPSHTIFQVRGR